MTILRSILVLVVSAMLTRAARADARWRVHADADVEAFLLSGIAFSIGASPAGLPSWRFSLAMRSHDIADAQIGMSGANDNMYVTMPIAVEAIARYRHRTGVVAGARAGMVHFHYTRIGSFGIDEEFIYGVTPFIGFEWSPQDNVYVQPWLGSMLPFYRNPHGELPMDDLDRTYARWPALIRGGISVGARF